MTSRPLFIPLLGAVAGLSLAGIGAVTVPAWGVAALLALTFGAIFTPARHLFTTLLFLSAFAWGGAALSPLLTAPPTPGTPAWYADDRDVTLEGVVDRRPERTAAGSRLPVRAERLWRDGREFPVSGRVLVYLREGSTPCVTGDRVRFVATLRLPRNFGLPGEPDYVRSLALKGIAVTAHLRDPGELVLIRGGADSPARAPLDRLAGRLGRFITESVPGEEGGILRALLLGDRGGVPPEIESAYTRAGVNHILSISGFHVAVVALAVFQLLLLLGRCSETLMLRSDIRRLALLAGVPVVVFYLFLSGAAPATARSVIMIVLVTLALFIHRETDPLNLLIVAALLLLGIEPPLLFDLSFQLSFLALWGLVVLTPIFMKPVQRWERGAVGRLLLLVAASLAAVVATLVPVAYYFHRSSATGIIANLVIVPLLGYGAVVVGFAALPFVPVAPGIARLLIDLAGFLVYLSDRIILPLARLPLLPHWTPTRLDLLLSLLCLTCLTSLTGRTRKGIAVAVLAGIMIAGHRPWQERHPPGLELTFFSLGQAESTLIRFPGGETMLVDGGGSLREGGADVGERLLAPALWSLGVGRFDVVALTHTHPDHLRGLRFIVENFPVGEFWESGRHGESDDYRALRAALARQGVPVRRVDGATGPLMIGEGRIEPLSPDPGPPGGDVNGDSLVFRLVWRELALLFTGDIGAATEARLLAVPARLRSDILKVAHHGSRYSSTEPFLDAVRPTAALVSAGYGNTFRLPAGETLERFTERRIPLYRTDLDGTITLRSGGRGFSVATMPPVPSFPLSR